MTSSIGDTTPPPPTGGVTPAEPNSSTSASSSPLLMGTALERSQALTNALKNVVAGADVTSKAQSAWATEGGSDGYAMDDGMGFAMGHVMAGYFAKPLSPEANSWTDQVQYDADEAYEGENLSTTPPDIKKWQDMLNPTTLWDIGVNWDNVSDYWDENNMFTNPLSTTAVLTATANVINRTNPSHTLDLLPIVGNPAALSTITNEYSQKDAIAIVASMARTFHSLGADPKNLAYQGLVQYLADQGRTIGAEPITPQNTQMGILIKATLEDLGVSVPSALSQMLTAPEAKYHAELQTAYFQALSSSSPHAKEVASILNTPITTTTLNSAITLVSQNPDDPTVALLKPWILAQPEALQTLEQEPHNTTTLTLALQLGHALDTSEFSAQHVGVVQFIQANTSAMVASTPDNIQGVSTLANLFPLAQDSTLNTLRSAMVTKMNQIINDQPSNQMNTVTTLGDLYPSLDGSDTSSVRNTLTRKIEEILSNGPSTLSAFRELISQYDHLGESSQGPARDAILNHMNHVLGVVLPDLSTTDYSSITQVTAAIEQLKSNPAFSSQVRWLTQYMQSPDATHLIIAHRVEQITQSAATPQTVSDALTLVQKYPKDPSIATLKPWLKEPGPVAQMINLTMNSLLSMPDSIEKQEKMITLWGNIQASGLQDQLASAVTELRGALSSPEAQQLFLSTGPLGNAFKNVPAVYASLRGLLAVLEASYQTMAKAAAALAALTQNTAKNQQTISKSFNDLVTSTINSMSSQTDKNAISEYAQITSALNAQANAAQSGMSSAAQGTSQAMSAATSGQQSVMAQIQQVLSTVSELLQGVGQSVWR